LLGLAKELKAEALVTGHYVQRRRAASGEWALCKAMDPRKDQSYFLFATTKEQLAFSHFPLGGWSKEQTRAVALSLGIPVANKPDSQDICFVPNGDYASVIAKLRPGALDPGEIVHADGRVLGHHAGIIHYTIGQRRGLGISSPEPLYVIRLEAEARRVIVGPESLLAQRHFTMHTPHWLGDGDFPEGPFEVTVRLRSAHRGALATVQRQGPNEARVTMHADEKAITPGQAAVFYDGDRVLGGGWIRRVLPAESVMEPVPSDTKCQI
jgi:tRNA-specific 2-thiouridylase